MKLCKQEKQAHELCPKAQKKVPDLRRFFFKTPTFVGFGKDLPRRHSEGEPPLSETPFVKFHHSSRSAAPPLPTPLSSAQQACQKAAGQGT